MKILYFAWLRSRIGLASEEVSPPPGVRDVAGLIEWLAMRSPAHEAALAQRDVVKAAVNQTYARPGDPIGPDDEVALFPPVTGG